MCSPIIIADEAVQALAELGYEYEDVMSQTANEEVRFEIIYFIMCELILTAFCLMFRIVVYATTRETITW